MKKYILPENGNFYKANLHCHSVYSDGQKTPEELKEIYKGLGYSVVAYTDHDILIPHDELNDEKFLALHGFEMELTGPQNYYGERKACHLCMIGIDPDNLTQPCWHRSDYLFGNAPKYREQVQFDDTLEDYVRDYSGEGISDIMQIGREKGFFVTYNHPTWSRETYAEYMNYSGMHAMEIMNGATTEWGFEDYNPRIYDDLLSDGRKLFCIGADDNHNFDPQHPDNGKAFTMIKAPALDYRMITAALINGDFYASEGPELHALWYEDGEVHLRCSEVAVAYCSYPIRKTRCVRSENGLPVTEASFDLQPNDGYFRITVIDQQGKHACTNAYFIEDLGLFD